MMPKSVVVNPGQPLTIEALKEVASLRSRFNDIPDWYDTDFNLYRWISSVQLSYRCKNSQDVIDKAEKLFRNHLQYRRLMRMDVQARIPNWDNNPLYTMGLLPRGYIIDQPDNQNRVVWFIEYKSMNFESMLTKLRSTEMVLYQFWLFDQVLRKVMEQEAKSGLLSSVFHVVDLLDFPLSPMNMLFVSNGSCAYFANLIHYEHYPQLVTTSYFVNCAKWMTVPYKLISRMMPSTFAEKFQLVEGNYTSGLQEHVDLDQIPTTLGGNNASIITIPTLPVDQVRTIDNPNIITKMTLTSMAHVDEVVSMDDKSEVEHQIIEDDVFLSEKTTPATGGSEGSVDASSGSDEDLSEDAPYLDDVSEDEDDSTRSKVTISARRRKIIPVEITKANTRLYWHYTTDADVYFGVFKHPVDKSSTSIKKLDNDQLEMVYPWLKLGAKMVPETDMILCKEPGTYYMIFCNRHSWFSRRNVHLKMDVHTVPFRIERTLSM